MPDRPVRFELPAYDYAAGERLEAGLGVSHALAQVLVRRGLGEPAAARAFLAAGETHPPSAFGGLEAAAGGILGHVSRRSRITIHGDYDADGVCSTAVLVRALRTLGGDVDWYLPSRGEDGYGLSAGTVARLAARGTALLVTADCGVTAVEEVAAARAAGLDVIVTDHHQPRADGALPDAPIVHPRLGRYPCPDLCATGVAYKLAGAVLGAAGLDPGLADEDLDLVALATVADVVPLVGENRRLVRAGLRSLATTAKPGLRALMAVARIDATAVAAGDVGFRLAPRINAAGRLRRADAGLELLLTPDTDRAAAVAAELDAVNRERRDVETRIRFEAEALVAAAPAGAPAYVLAGEGWHPGVIGIVAARIAERHHRPAVLIALDGDEGTGSGRSIPAFDLLAGLQAGADVLGRHGGHRAAAGLSIERRDVDAFRAAFCAHAAAVLRPQDLVPTEHIDAVVPGDALRLELAEELERLAPFGAGNPPVSLLVPCAHLDDPRPMGEGRHVAFTLAAGGARSRAVAFGAGSRLPAEPATPVDVAVRLELNRWNGAVEPRLVLRHARRPTPPPIDVLGEPESFLAGVLAELDRDLGAWARNLGGDEAWPDEPSAPPALAPSARAKPRTPAGEEGAPGAPPVPQTERGQPPDHTEAQLTMVAGAAARPDPGNSSTAAGGGRETPGRGDADGARATADAHRTNVNDQRGKGIAGLLADLVATGDTVLAVAADAPHRSRALADRLGGFAICSWAALEDDPSLAAPFVHVVALDPPTHRPALARDPSTAAWTHLAWGEPELGFSRRTHERDYALREPLAAAYRALRAAGGGSGESCEAVLRGDGPQSRPAALAGRLVRILAELRLVTFDRDGPALTVVEAPGRTALERSPAFRAYQRRFEDGLRYLTTSSIRAAA